MTRVRLRAMVVAQSVLLPRVIMDVLFSQQHLKLVIPPLKPTFSAGVWCVVGLVIHFISPLAPGSRIGKGRNTDVHQEEDSTHMVSENGWGSRVDHGC